MSAERRDGERHERPKVIIDEVPFYRAQCTNCGWVGNVEEWHHTAKAEGEAHECDT